MPKPSDLILGEIRELKSWLYGADGFKGDIPEITQRLKDLNGKVRSNEVRSKINQALIGLFSTGIMIALTKIVGIW